MHRHLLIGIDESAHALKAARYAIRLAKSVDAMATVAIVTAPLKSVVPGGAVLDRLQSEYDAHIERQAERCLAKVRAISLENGFVCETVHVSSAQPAEALLKVADEQGCDLVIVSNHKGRAVEGLELVGEVIGILARSSIPILLYRE